MTNPLPAAGEVWVNGKGDEIVVQDYDFAYAVVWSRTYGQYRLVSASHFGTTYKLRES